MTRSAFVASLLVSLVGCGLGLTPRGDVAEPAATPADTASPAGTAAAAATQHPEALRGIDLADLKGRERVEFWEIAGSLFAPCRGEAVPLPQCVEEARACAGCTPMAQLVADHVKRGGTRSNVKAAAIARFSHEVVKEVPLRDSPAKGPPGAPVVIVAFSDFECPACKAALPILEEVQREHAQEVRLVHKFYPLAKHMRAKDAAFAAVAAMKQGKYWEMEKIIFENQDELSDQDLERYAATIGLDMDKFRADWRSSDTKAIVERDMKDADELGLSHTPYILINGRLFDTAYFRLDRDIDEWVETEIELTRAAASAKKSPAP